MAKKAYPEEKLKLKRSVTLPREVVLAAEASGDTLSEWLSEAGRQRAAKDRAGVQEAPHTGGQDSQEAEGKPGNATHTGHRQNGAKGRRGRAA